MVSEMTCDRELHQWRKAFIAAINIGMDCGSRRLVSQPVNEAQQECCALQVGVIVTPCKWLKEFDATAYITKDASFFSGSSLLRIPQLSVLVGEHSYVGWVTT